MKRLILTLTLLAAMFAPAAAIVTAPAAHADPTHVQCKDGAIGFGTDSAAACKDHGGPAPAITCPDGSAGYQLDNGTTCGGGNKVVCNDGSPAPHGDVALCGQSSNCVKTGINYNSSGTSEVCNNGHGIIINFLLAIVRFLGGLIGLVVILMIIIGAIQYMTAQGNPQAVAAAKGRITNAITALVLYLLMFGILQYLIPGGIFQ